MTWFMGIVSSVLVSFGGVAANRIFANPTPPLLNRTSVSCSTIAGYPLGIWKIDGVQVRYGPEDTSFAKEIIFRTPTTGIWFEGLGKQQRDGNYPLNPEAPFAASKELSPGAEVLLTFHR
jgi:hypothetical protein